MNPDMILITEAWCNEEISDAFLSIPGYTLQQDLRTDRADTAGGRGGGLLVYTKIGITILSLDKVVTFNQYCKFLIGDVTVYLIYRPPSGGQISIDQLTDLIRGVEKKSVLIGDFNFPEIDWDTWTTGARSRSFLEAAEEKLLEQMVRFSTHTKGNILDLVLSNIPERVLEVKEAGRLGHSDHTMIDVTLTVHGRAGGTRCKEQPDWNRADWPYRPNW